MDQWRSKFSESFSLDWHWSIECSSLKMTSALQKSECCCATSAVQRSENLRSNFRFRLWHDAGVGVPMQDCAAARTSEFLCETCYFWRITLPECLGASNTCWSEGTSLPQVLSFGWIDLLRLVDTAPQSLQWWSPALLSTCFASDAVSEGFQGRSSEGSGLRRTKPFAKLEELPCEKLRFAQRQLL